MPDILNSHTIQYPFSLSDLIMRIEYTPFDKPLYIAFAHPGTAEGTLGWQIQKITYDDHENVIEVGFASGKNTYEYSYTLRATYSYS